MEVGEEASGGGVSGGQDLPSSTASLPSPWERQNVSKGAVLRLTGRVLDRPHRDGTLARLRLGPLEHGSSSEVIPIWSYPLFPGCCVGLFSNTEACA